nr:isoform delta of flowering time control protein fca [Quercus suber]
MERQRGDRFNGQQESQHQNQQLSDHHSHHEQQQQHHFNNSNYQVQDQQHLNNPNYHSNYHHHDQHFNNSNYQQHPPHHHNHHQHVNFEPNDSSSFGSGGFPPNSGAGGYGSGSGYSVRKRGRHRGDTPVVDKLYVGCLNKDASKMEVEEIFSAYGLIEDVYIVRDELKQSRGCGFVKFSHWEMALAAIKALNGTFKMRGCDQPLIVRFADPKKPKIGEPRGNHIFANTNFAPCSQEPFARNMVAPGLGNSMGGCILPNASYPLRANSTSSLPQSVSQMEKQEPFVQQSFPPLQQLPSQLAQMPLQQTRTPQTSSQSSQLEGSEVQRQSHQTEKVEQQLSSQSPTVASSSTSPAGCDQPLIVRFADPKKPKIGEPRGNHIFANTNFAPCSQEPFARNMVAPGLGNSMGGCILPNASYPLRANSTSSLPQSVSQMEKQEPFVQQSFPPLQQLPSQLAQMPLQQTRTPQTSSQSSQLEGSEVQRQSHQTEKVEQQLSSQSPTVASSSTSPAVPLSPHTTASLECDWSEHTCPDGHKYYYNCVTRESRWMKPQEYALHEQQLVKHQNLQNPSQQLQSSLPVLSSQQVIQIEQELDHVQLQSESSPVIGPTCA